MTTRITKQNDKMPCGYCNELFYEDEYRDHVQNCNKSDEENEDQPTSKLCSSCGMQVKDLTQHGKTCSRRNDKTNNGFNNMYNSQTSSIQQPSKSIISKRQSSKKCPTCSDIIGLDKFQEHVENCDDGFSPKLKNSSKTEICPTCSETIDAYEFTDHIDYCRARSLRTSINVKKTNKRCPTCSETVEADDFAGHIRHCGIGSSRKSIQQKTSKRCPTCSETIEADDFAGHIRHCSTGSPRKSIQQKTSKRCPTCSETIEADDFAGHIRHCGTGSPRKSIQQKTRKRCPTCFETIDGDEFPGHIRHCGIGSSRRSLQPKTSKQCPTCSETFEASDFADHTRRCDGRAPRQQTTMRDTEACPVCSKDIPRAESQRHVNDCLTKSSASTKNTLSRTVQQSCFTCSSPIDSSKNFSHTMPCRAKHIYCLKCLQQSMNEFIGSNTAPVCNPTLCTYELSRYDVECLPIEPDIITRLLPLVKTTQRPQCPSCFFYVEIKTKDDLQRHVLSCNPNDILPCEYCHCLFNKHRLNEHSQQCRINPPSQQRQEFINFLLPRTKYQLTPAQMQVYLEERRKSRLSLDTHSIINSLAEFEGAFPFDVATRDCDICMNSYVYDDIFVFGCKDSHKTCYECFADSCKTKMNSNELLTCAMCVHQLLDGEINQIRLPADQKRQFVEYQTQKTFGAYASGQGIIRCPNQKCRWVAESQNPDERFFVECKSCHEEFCSLCSAQYHFRTTCQEIPELTQRWFFWCNTERGNYWQARAQQDANFRANLEDYEKQRAANEQRNNELQQRYNDLLIDENYKAQNCRLCPNCGRVVQRLAGCDSMICGQNYHGGDVQSGCGHRFSWPQAAPYVPIGSTGPEQVANNMPPPEEQKLVVHEGVQCDACGNEVQGIRFDCIHCSSLTFCEKCEQRATLEHSDQIRNRNKPQHVFRLITAAATGNK